MLLLLGKLPKTVTIALSGGIDSMVLLDFLSRKHTVKAAFFDHGTENSKKAREFVTIECKLRGIDLNIGDLSGEKPKHQSHEEFWRIKRYEFLDNFNHVVTAHHLDDVAETWVWSSLHGTSSLMPYQRNNVIRPFLLNRKSNIQHWAESKNVRWCEDSSNRDFNFTRNLIRYKLMPNVLQVNPGIHTMLRKKLVERYKNFTKDID